MDGAGPRRKLPTGIQTFREIRESGCYYVDKTGYIERLVEDGKHYFLSRPRRFGKSLLLDTIKELFEGSEALFEGTRIYRRWDWSARHPVLRLSFGRGGFKEPGDVRENVAEQLAAMERSAGVDAKYATASGRLAHLIRSLHERSGRRVAVLVDEYDKPILDALGEPAVALANRDYLRGLYGTIKDSDADVRFTLLTGVSKFSKASLFSDLNNLTDITLDRRYAAVCGYTEADLDAVFAPELPGLDRERTREWYNGYCWRGEKVYNPYDVLLLFDTREYAAHWFETGSPRFLVETLVERSVPTPSLDGMLGTNALLSAFDVEHMATEALLFQTGYLTILEEQSRSGKAYYRLGYPNREVRESLNENLLGALVPAAPLQTHTARLYDLLLANDFAGLETLFRAFFASIPHQWHMRNEIASYEGYYASVFYSHFAAAGLDVAVEDSGSAGRLDMAVRFNSQVYLFEFKVLERAGEGAAMAQLKARGYADKYRHLGEPIHLLGVEFSSASRSVASFEAQRA